MRTATILLHALMLRCPYCGQGKLFRRGFAMYETCPVCGLRFEREEGYWTGAVALNLTVLVLILFFALIPLAIAFVAAHQPLILFVLVSLPLPVLVPILLFRHSKSFWLGIDFLINPGTPDEWM